MSQRDTALYPITPGDWILDAANEYTPMVLTESYRNIVVTITVSSSAGGTIKFYESTSEARPTLANAASSTNEYSVVECVDLDTGLPIVGSTGIVYAGSSDGIHMYEVQSNLNRWFGVKMTARSAGAVSISIALSNNQ